MTVDSSCSRPIKERVRTVHECSLDWILWMSGAQSVKVSFSVHNVTPRYLTERVPSVSPVEALIWISSCGFIPTVNREVFSTLIVRSECSLKSLRISRMALTEETESSQNIRRSSAKRNYHNYLFDRRMHLYYWSKEY